MAAHSPDDADLTFHQHGGRGAKAATEAIRASLSDVWQRDLDLLRQELDARLGALETMVRDSDLAPPIERLVQELSGVAARQAEEAADRARFDAKQAAGEQLAAVRAEAQAKLDQAHADQAALLQTIDALQAQTEAAVSAAQAEVHATQEGLTAARHQAMTARQEVQERTAELEATARRLEVREEACARAEQALTDSEACLAAETRERTALAASLDAAHHATAAARAEADASLADNARLREAIETLQGRLREAAVAQQMEVEAVRAELTAAVEDAQIEHASLSEALTAARQDVSAARQEVQDRTVGLETAEQRLREVEEAHARAQQALADSEARLAAEARDKADLATALESARHAAAVASSDIDASRAELAHANARIEVFQEQLAARRPDVEVLDRLHRSLQAFVGLTDIHDVLTTYLKEFEGAFDRVALFVVRENRLEGWDSVGFEPTTNVRNLIIPFTVDSPLTRAASGRTSIVIEDEADEPTPGLLGHDTYGAVSIPIVTDRGHLAVAHAEMARRLQPDSRRLELHAADILAEHVMGLLTHLERAAATATAASSVETSATGESMSAPAYPGPARAAQRVRMSDRVDVVIDGAAAELVDMSNLGAQVTCARTIRPNRQVRMLIPEVGPTALCCGHVMWALFELAPDGGRYRAGLKFTRVDTTAVEAFLSQQVANRQRTSA